MLVIWKKKSKEKKRKYRIAEIVNNKNVLITTRQRKAWGSVVVKALRY